MSFKVPSAILTCAKLLLLAQGLNPTGSTASGKSIDSSRRIYYGHSAALSDFPYLVYLDIKGGIGGGAIIMDNWILTAGHVPYKQDCAAITILPVAWAPGEGVHPVECFTHDGYRNISYAYDVGLLRTAENLLQDGRAQAIPLPAPGTIYAPGMPAIIVGWGVTETGEPAPYLLQAELQVKDWNFCNEEYKQNLCKGEPRCIARDMPTRVICTHGDNYPVPNTCYGDSGSPVIIAGAVAGIVSFGIPDGNLTCRPGSPSMHTDVVDYLPWIYSIIAPEMDTSSMVVRPENPW